MLSSSPLSETTSTAVERMDRIEQQCIARGTRLTRKRKHVLSVLLTANKAMSAYDIAQCYEDELGEVIPPMSVYRILDFLQEEHLVHKLDLANKYIACSHADHDHEHRISQFLICQQCQRVEEVDVQPSVIKNLKQSIEKAGFQLDSQQLELHCICDGCASN